LGPHEARWQNVLAYLAQEILTTAVRLDLVVEELQRSRLVPLELDLLDRSPQWAARPEQLAMVVLGVLE
jgi:hypothetical protein